ncbi:MAG: hypothetical protein D6730_00865 [Bacteroidetes bacterium]|nr:MAG: hypothetical protein D6730_00865 [Bacteroidota bacterium]
MKGGARLALPIFRPLRGPCSPRPGGEGHFLSEKVALSLVHIQKMPILAMRSFSIEKVAGPKFTLIL